MKVIIKSYNVEHQDEIDTMLDSIREEYSENIFSPTYKKISELYQLPDRRYWSAESAGRIVGTIGVIQLQNSAVLKAMFLQKEFRGREYGIATQLLETAEQWAHENGSEMMWLGTMHQFKAAQRFYSRNGYSGVDESELPKGYPGNGMDTVFFVKKL